MNHLLNFQMISCTDVLTWQQHQAVSVLLFKVYFTRKFPLVILAIGIASVQHLSPEV